MITLSWVPVQRHPMVATHSCLIFHVSPQLLDLQLLATLLPLLISRPVEWIPSVVVRPIHVMDSRIMLNPIRYLV